MVGGSGHNEDPTTRRFVHTTAVGVPRRVVGSANPFMFPTTRRETTDGGIFSHGASWCAPRSTTRRGTIHDMWWESYVRTQRCWRIWSERRPYNVSWGQQIALFPHGVSWGTPRRAVGVYNPTGSPHVASWDPRDASWGLRYDQIRQPYFESIS